MRQLICTIFCLMIVCSPAGAAWKRTVHDFSDIEVLKEYKNEEGLIKIPVTRVPAGVCSYCYWGKYLRWVSPSRSYAFYVMSIGRGQLSGRAEAKDVLFGAEVGIGRQATSYEYQVWKHFPPGVGEIELKKEVEISGHIDLKSSACAAAALGSATAMHSFDGRKDELKAVVTRTIAATAANVVAQIQLPLFFAKGVLFSVPIKINVGTGKLSDNGGGRRTATASHCPVIIAERDQRVTGYLKCWANAGFWSVLFGGKASCEADLAGVAVFSKWLVLTHLTCPGSGR